MRQDMIDILDMKGQDGRQQHNIADHLTRNFSRRTIAVCNLAIRDVPVGVQFAKCIVQFKIYAFEVCCISMTPLGQTILKGYKVIC